MFAVHQNYRIIIVVSKELTSRIAFDLYSECILSLWYIRGGKVSYWVGKSNGWREGFDNFFRRPNNNSEKFLNMRKKLRKKKEDEMKVWKNSIFRRWRAFESLPSSLLFLCLNNICKQTKHFVCSDFYALTRSRRF